MQNLQKRFQMTDLGNIFHCLGIEVDINLNKETINL